MLIEVPDDQATAVLGALRRVATAGGTACLTEADERALAAFDRFVLRRTVAADLTALPDTLPAQLASKLHDGDVANHVVQFLIVMALIDGVVDEAKIAVVVEYAERLGVHEDAVRQLAELGHGNLAWVRADVQRQNLLSVTGGVPDVPIDEFLQPYRAGHADPALTERYRGLRTLPVGTLGRAFFDFYSTNRFAFPGEPPSVNERFAAPHDTTHLLSGYDTSPQGELLVSTFTAGMHPREPMSGHILPVIISWHLGIELVHFAGAVSGQLDPDKFWCAWERGAEVTTDVFGEAWNLWDVAGDALEDLRAAYHVPPLDPAYAAHGVVPPWYRPVP